MYSRAKDRPRSPIRLPDHYSGWAFRDLPPNDTQDPPLPHSAPPDAIPLSPRSTQESESCHSPTVSPEPPCEQHQNSSAPPCFPSQKPPPPSFLQPFEHLFGKVGSAFPFSHGLGFDELMILGLIILLSHSDHDPDVLLLLGLLLFCG